MKKVQKNQQNSMTPNKYSYIILLIFTWCLPGCSNNTVINRGYDVATVDFSQIKPGTDTIQDVWDKFGSPTIRSSVIQPNGDYCWYYSSKNLTKSGFLKPTLQSKQLWIITFNKNNIVKSIKLSNNENPVHMVSDTSKSGGKTKGVINETFGGIGKYMHKYDK